MWLQPSIRSRLPCSSSPALATQPVKDSYARLRFDIRETASPKEFSDFIAAERKVWGPVIRNAKVRLD